MSNRTLRIVAAVLVVMTVSGQSPADHESIVMEISPADVRSTFAGSLDYMPDVGSSAPFSCIRPMIAPSPPVLPSLVDAQDPMRAYPAIRQLMTARWTAELHARIRPALTWAACTAMEYEEATSPTTVLSMDTSSLVPLAPIALTSAPDMPPPAPKRLLMSNDVFATCGVAYLGAVLAVPCICAGMARQLTRGTSTTRDQSRGRRRPATSRLERSPTWLPSA
ncbi:MAG: hypothetical protein AAF432_13045 [Planctomycetota bacterium]